MTALLVALGIAVYLGGVMLHARLLRAMRLRGEDIGDDGDIAIMAILWPLVLTAIIAVSPLIAAWWCAMRAIRTPPQLEQPGNYRKQWEDET